MKIETKYELKDRVFISALNIAGIVVSYYYITEVEYKVRYFDNGDVREVYFYEKELEKLS